jgi:hypothetical protein
MGQDTRGNNTNDGRKRGHEDSVEDDADDAPTKKRAVRGKKK